MSHWALIGGGGFSSSTGASPGESSGGVNSQTANYTAALGDSGKLISFNSASAVSLTLPSPPSSTWNIAVENVGAGPVSILVSNRFPAGWTNRLVGVANTAPSEAMVTFDQAAPTATSYSATITATASSNLFAVMAALKPSGTSVPAYVQGAVASVTNGIGSGTLTVTFNMANSAGNCLVLDCYLTSGSRLASAPTVTDSNGNTWSFVAGGNGTLGSAGGTTPNYSMFVASNCAGGANTVTMTCSIGFDFIIGAVHEYSGVVTTSPIDVSDAVFNTSVTSLSPSVTTTGTNRLLHLFGASYDNYLVSHLIDGSYVGLSLNQNQGCQLFTDGTNFFTQRGIGSAASGSAPSVALSMPSEFSVSGSPVTGSGTITVTKATAAANAVYAGPSSGSAATPTFRAIVPADLPAASTSALGVVRPDNSTVTISSGVLSVPTATTSASGLVKPDGTTITIASGVISASAAVTATSSTLGVVKPDNSTLTIASGVLSVPTATTSAPGLVKPDGTTITISSGVISASAPVTATSSTLGVVRPDNSTLNIASGVLSVPTATTSSLGLVKPDGTTITISGGVISSAGGSSSTTHVEPLTDGQGNLIFANGDVVMVFGVSN